MSQFALQTVFTNPEQAKAAIEKERKSAYMAARYAADPERIKRLKQESLARHPDALRARRKRYVEENKTVVKAYQDAYKEAHREKAREYARAYRAANPKKVAASINAWYAANPGAMQVKKQNRREKARGAGKLSRGIVQTLIKLQKNKCASCGCCLKKAGRHIDHIMPLAKGGANTDENVQLLCPPCNLKKSSKDPIDWAQENGRLL